MAAPPPATNYVVRAAAGSSARVQLGRIPGSVDEKYITEKYRIWMKGGEAKWAAVPLSLSPPAGVRGLWEGHAEVASAKVPSQAGPTPRARGLCAPRPGRPQTSTCPVSVSRIRCHPGVLVLGTLKKSPL